MNRSLVLALHEVRIFLQDRGDLAFSLLLPIAIFALMYGAFGADIVFHGTAYVVNEDPGGAYSDLLVERLGEIDNLDIEQLSKAKADSKLDRSDILMAIYIPSDFSAKLTGGESATLIFKQRGNGGQVGQIVASIVQGVAGGIAHEFQVQGQVADALDGTGIEQAGIEVTVQKFMERERGHPIVSVSARIIGSSPDPVKQFLPGIVTMFVLFAITISSKSIVAERKKGTLERLLTTRMTVGELFAGKFLANNFRGFVQTFILLALGYMVFQMFTPLSFIESLIIALVYIAAVSAIGLIIGSVSRTENQADWIAVFFTMAMTMLGGTFFEISEGSPLYTISKASMNTYANDAFKVIIADGGSLADVGLELGVLAGVAVIGLAISRVFFRVVPGGK
ncbi:MAG: ABC transporter permease [Chloroflexota bacterium]|nr:ABC transporter permease [Chloroflexota bacterium]